jgi:hypothetical protein
LPPGKEFDPLPLPGSLQRLGEAHHAAVDVVRRAGHVGRPL